MPDEVKPKRQYRSPRRAAHAEQTQRAILKAARESFLSSGWSRTTIAAIADAAMVSKETVYAVFGTKRAILQRLIVDAVRREMRDVALIEQPGPRAIAEEAQQRRQVVLFAADVAAVLSGVAPFIAVVRAAAEAEPELGAFYRDLHEGRRKNLAFFVEALRGNGALRNGMGIAEATQTVWRLASPELFMVMRDIEGLTTAEYAAWLGDSLTVLLLPAGPEHAG